MHGRFPDAGPYRSEGNTLRLSDANQRPGLHGLGQRQETMKPAKSRTLGYMEPLTDLTQAQPVSQGFSLPQPLIAQMQMR